MVLLTGANTHMTFGQERSLERPPIIPLRQLENYEFLKDSSKASLFFDPIKFIPLNRKKDTYISLGGEIKTFYESILNREDEGEGYLLTRFMIHADIHLGTKFRIFIQPASGFDFFKEAPASIVDRDELFLLNFFAVYKFLQNESNSLAFRLGRQELNYGRGRLITIREGPNIRHYWEGISLLFDSPKWKGDAFFTKYGTNKSGVFDNPIWDNEETFWGSYWQSKKTIFKNTKLNVYYLGFIDNVSQFFNATGKETRHSIGGRLYKTQSQWDYDIEITGQFGNIGDADILAIGFFGEVGYTLKPDATIKHRIGLKTDYFTGDRDAADNKANTFNPMYPRQGYYRGSGALYAANYWDIHPSFSINVANNFSFLVDWTWYWRVSSEDGIYIGGSGIPQLAPNESSKKYLGSQLDFEFSYRLNEYINTTINYAHFYSGGFVEENPTPTEISDFLNVSLLFRF
ncbi:alginate export family protein [Aquimarina mytili]|nr:alginate export family protein [Aquimarina mytili]